MNIIIHGSICEICANGIQKTKQCYSKGWDKCKGKYFEHKTKLSKESICVFIENESQLQQAMELLERYGCNIATQTWGFGNCANWNYLNYTKMFDDWGIGCERRNKITLTELEEILKGEKDD